MRPRPAVGAGGGNRTRIISLEGWGSTIELYPRNPSQTLAKHSPARLANQKTEDQKLPSWSSSSTVFCIFPFLLHADHVQVWLNLTGGGGWIRTTEAFASDLQSDPFGHSGTPPDFPL